jgi:hypothetical protein
MTASFDLTEVKANVGHCIKLMFRDQRPSILLRPILFPVSRRAKSPNIVLRRCGQDLEGWEQTAHIEPECPDESCCDTAEKGYLLDVERCLRFDTIVGGISCKSQKIEVRIVDLEP